MLATQVQAPFLEAVLNYVSGDVLGFNVPGHHQGRGAPESLRKLLGEAALQADITQVLGMDDLHHPRGVTGAAQELAAQAYGADFSYFLVNGSTSGNHAMLLAALRPGDTVLVPRNAHRSVMAGLVLADARPVYYIPPYDAAMGVHHAADPTSLQRLLDAHPQARAMLITSPTYYGATADVHALVELAHSRGLVALVDEAWGAHLAFHPQLPASAVAAGADLVVQSTHKLLAGLSQGSILHLRGSRIDRARLEQALKMLLTTSPSCLLVASLDAARQQMVNHGRELLDRLLQLAGQARARLAEVPGVRVYGSELIGRPGVHGIDPTRLVFSVCGYSGYEVERELRQRANLQLEMSDRRLALAQLTCAHTGEQIERLVGAVRSLAPRPPLELRPSGHPTAPLRLTPRQAFDANRETVVLEAAVGRVSAETIGIYPPGIPIVCAGEEITADVLAELTAERAAGASLQGGHDPEMRAIDVITS